MTKTNYIIGIPLVVFTWNMCRDFGLSKGWSLVIIDALALLFVFLLPTIQKRLSQKRGQERRQQ
jgi:hypothetical protein